MTKKIHNKGVKGWTNRGSFQKGHKTNIGKTWVVSKEGRLSMSLGQKGKISGFKGKKHTPEARLKNSIHNKGKIKSPSAYSFFSGDKNPKWKGGITDYIIKVRTSLEYRLWRSKIFQRDNWTCQTCHQRGGNLEAHHIIPFHQLIKTEFEYLIFDINNGVALCEECHRLTKVKN